MRERPRERELKRAERTLKIEQQRDKQVLENSFKKYRKYTLQSKKVSRAKQLLIVYVAGPLYNTNNKEFDPGSG